MKPKEDLVYIVQLHAQTPRNGDPKITVRIPAKDASSRSEAMQKAESVAALRSGYDMGWIATSCYGPQIDNHGRRPRGA